MPAMGHSINNISTHLCFLILSGLKTLKKEKQTKIKKTKCPFFGATALTVNINKQILIYS